MTRGSLGVRTSVGTTGAAAFELIAPAGTGVWLREMMVVLAAATASTLGLGYPAAIGITPTTPVRLLNEEGGNTFVHETKIAVAWGTGPTIPANFFRRIGFPAAINSQILWTFTKGIYIPAGGSIILWNLASNGVLDVTVSVDE